MFYPTLVALTIKTVNKCLFYKPNVRGHLEMVGKRQLKREKYQCPNFTGGDMNAHCLPIPEETSQAL